MVLLHGAGGGFDELAIVVVALAVVWLAVRLAGRRPADGTEPAESEEARAANDESESPPTRRPSSE